MTELASQNGLELSALSEVSNLRDGSRVLETNLRRSDDERLSEVSQLLASQDVEIVSGRRDLGKLEVDVLCSEVVISAVGVIRRRVNILEESLDMAG